MTDRRILARRFETERPRLVAIATRLLGTTGDADDAVQEAWLRLERANSDEIENLEAWLTTVVSRISLDILRSPRRTRVQSWQVEQWRDEPSAPDLDPAELVAQSDQVNVALFVVLELLSPSERTAFVLHDVFGRGFDEIGELLEKSPEATRKLASRARRKLRGAEVPSRPHPAQSRRIVDAWLDAAQHGNVDTLLSLLADDAVLHADFGPTSKLIEGAQDIAGQAVLSARLAAHATPVLIGGRPGVASIMGGRVVSLMAFTIAGGRITALDVLADRKRLEGLDVDSLR